MDDSYDNAEVRDVIEREGLEYAITGYLSADNIKDPKLRKMWNKARVTLEAIQEYLEIGDFAPEEEDVEGSPA
jgi:hypothetical protein